MILVRLRNHIGHRFGVRLMEWEHAIFLIAVGAILTLPRKDLVALPHEEAWGVLLLVLGLVRLGSLIVNGLMQRVTAWARAVSSILSSMIFCLIALGYAWSGRLGVVMALCLITALFEWANYGRALRDAGRAG